MTRSWTRACVAVIGSLVALSASAHHSFAIFDHTQTLTLQGKVASFQWTNPHGYLALDITDGPKKNEHYTIELTSINMLRRAGWKSSDVQAGDAVTAVIDWVEKGTAPDSLVASKIVDGKVVRSRPLCPYPQVARYKGEGSVDSAASFHCVAPPR